MGIAQVLSRSMTVRESSSEHWDETEFRAVFLQHYARIVAILMRLLGDLSHAATNLGIDALRASGRRRRYEEAAGGASDEGGVGGPLDALLREEKCRRVRVVLALIKPTQAQLLILRSSGLSYKELADALDVKVSGIGTMLNRAEEEFRIRYLALNPNQEEL